MLQRLIADGADEIEVERRLKCRFLISMLLKVLPTHSKHEAGFLGLESLALAS